MFDRCRKWRRQLTRRADGGLPPDQWGKLEAHLARCPRCRAAQAADDALASVLGMHTGSWSRTRTHAFDDRVVAELGLTAAPVAQPVGWLTERCRQMQETWNALSLGFFTQVAGGALAAAAITAICFSSALRPAHLAPGAENAQNRAARALTAHNEPPVPLESLLNTPSPRAALLWTKPASGEKPKPSAAQQDRNAPHPASTSVPFPSDSDDHGELMRSDALG